MFVVKLLFAAIILYGICWSADRIGKELRDYRQKRDQEQRLRSMLSESNPFFARRVCRWIDHPEQDPDLTWAVQCGEYPSLLVYLKRAASQNR